jgi:hypothetical protein
MVGHIRQDESPHVEYLRTALSEVRTRTIATVDGGEISGRSVVDGLLHRALRAMTRERREEQRADVRQDLIDAMQAVRRPERLLEQFDALDAPWTPPARTGFEPPAEETPAQ